MAEERAASNQRAAQLAAQEWERERVHLVAAAQEAELHLSQALAAEKALKGARGGPGSDRTNGGRGALTHRTDGNLNTLYLLHTVSSL